MSKFTRLREIGDYLYLTFKIRQWLLMSVVVLAVVPGVFIFDLPFEARLVYVYVYMGVAGVAIFAMTNFFSVSIVQLIGIGLFGRKSTTIEYSTPEITQLAKKMGISKQIKVYITNNRFVKGPFTNGFTGTVYLTEEWVKKFHHKEVIATLAHEFGHVKNGRRFSLEMALATGAVLAFATVLAFHQVSVIVQISGFAAMMLVMPHVSHRNEVRADAEGARAVGPEGLISVFEQLKAESKRDDGSETHPSLGERIKRLMKMLDESGEALQSWTA